MNKNKILLWITLSGVVALTFALQLRFYTESLNSLIFAIGIILVFDVIKVFSEIAIFKNNSRIAKLFFGLIAVSLISFSAFATFSTRVHLADNRTQEIESKKLSVNQENKIISDKKALLKGELKAIDEQISTKRELIKTYQNDVKNKWLVWRLNKELNELLQKRETISPKVIAGSQAHEKQTGERTFQESLEKITGLESSFLTILIYAFQSIFLELGVLVICFFLVEKKEIKKKSSQLIDKQEIDSQKSKLFKDENIQFFDDELTGERIKEIRENRGLSQVEMAKELGITQKKLSRLERGESRINNELQNRLSEWVF